ncbi:calcium-binding protein [Chelatococcus sp. XZ-Ab1]|uniref:calcium-binding protein n=1 Tax=Chelatococcus sp. XZ-Ab1 TaxID=3034027 RepID=UPI0023E433EE|nr:calcium-binding protein [Chelatococcus sp. XZ-Ab1]
MPVGTDDDDRLYGTRFADVLEGLGGNDDLVGYAGDDSLFGGDGNDRLWGGPGVDLLDGGAGRDTAVYLSSLAGVSVDLRLSGPQESAGDAAGDVLVGIENVTGSRFDDVLIGDSGNNTLRGGAGADIIDGGDGMRDRASYAFSPEAVDVNLDRPGPQIGGDAQGDMLYNIEDLTGSSHDDRLTGNNRDNVINGGAGADMIDGRGGSDTVEYTGSPKGVNVDLTRSGPQIGGYAQGDVLISIENVYGTEHDDYIAGNSGANRLSGGAGNDVIIGGTGWGYDHINAGTSDDLVVLNGVGRADGGEGIDHLVLDFRAAQTQLAPGPGGNWEFVGFSATHNADTGEIYLSSLGVGKSGAAVGFEQLTIEGSTGRDSFIGTPGADVIRGHEGNDFISGGGGADFLDGGTGFDRLMIDERDATDDLLVDVASGIIPGGATAIGFEHLVVMTGSGNDTVYGLDGDSGLGNLAGVTLTGDYFLLGDGDDVAYGGAGGDRLDGEAGNDRLYGEAGNDHFYGGDGDDQLWGGTGADVFNYVGNETGYDRIEDFEDGSDRIRFLGGPLTNVDEVLAASREVDGGVAIDFGDGGIFIAGIELSDLDAGDFLFGY